MARQSEPGPPGALQNVSGTADDGGIVLRWSAPAHDGGSEIQRYEARYAAGASVPDHTPWILNGTFTSRAFRQLTNGTLYSFEVWAVNAQGTGPAAEIQATPGPPLSVPQSLTATADDSGVVLRWSRPCRPVASSCPAACVAQESCRDPDASASTLCTAPWCGGSLAPEGL